MSNNDEDEYIQMMDDEEENTQTEDSEQVEDEEELVEDDDDDDDDEEEFDDYEEEEDEEDEDEDDEEEDDAVIFIKPAGGGWRRKRIASEDYTTDEKRVKAVQTLKILGQNEPTKTLKEILDKYKISQSVTNDDGCKWVIQEVEKIIATSRRPDTIRISAVCNQLMSMLNIEDESEPSNASNPKADYNINETPGMSNLLFHLFTIQPPRNAEEDDKTKEEDNNISRFRRLLSTMNTQTSGDDQTMKFFKTLPEDKQQHYIDTITSLKSKINSNSTNEIPYLLKVMDLDIDDTTKQTIIEHITTFDKMSSSSSEYHKKKNLIKAIKALPFGKIASLPQELSDAMSDSGPSYIQRGRKRTRTDKGNRLIKFLDNTKASIDTTIYGHAEAKNQTLRLIASMISNGSAQGGHCFALEGPPGVGKTAIAGEIAKALGRPCVKINMGGASDGDDFVGHGYTYEGSTYGRIARSMMNAGCENPVMIFDELDKVSMSHKGQEINNILIHMTDSTQNHIFQDKYLAGININLSKVVMIFSFNDRSNISPILLDRMKIIRVGGYKINDKVVIAKKHLIGSIIKDLGYTDCNYMFEDIVIRDMINQYTFEGGVRKLKELLTDIIMEMNLRKITGQKVCGKDPIDIKIITKAMIRDDLFKEKQPVQHTMVATENQAGLVNGLWANSYGVGGLIPIQAHIIPASTKFELQLTGMQGKVMEESMKVAKTVAWRLLPERRRQELMKSWAKEGPTGIHIHCPDGSTPKDGPSAGGAITTCLVSLLTNTPVNQTYAMTGEINLKGDITAIGGLEEKMFGAITAGVKTILYPVENQRDADKIRDKYPDIFNEKSSTHIKMLPVDRIEQILEYVLIK